MMQTAHLCENTLTLLSGCRYNTCTSLEKGWKCCNVCKTQHLLGFTDILLYLFRDHFCFNTSTLAARTHLDQVRWKIDVPRDTEGFGHRHGDAAVPDRKPQQQPWKTGRARNDSCSEQKSAEKEINLCFLLVCFVCAVYFPLLSS